MPLEAAVAASGPSQPYKKIAPGHKATVVVLSDKHHSRLKAVAALKSMRVSDIAADLVMEGLSLYELPDLTQTIQ